MGNPITSKINNLLDIKESYKAPERIMSIISNETEKKEVFLNFLEAFKYDVSYDWFMDYFESEHSDRKEKKQDFTPKSVSELLARIAGGDELHFGTIYEPATGTGGTLINHWYRETRKYRYPWLFSNDNYLYLCEELSDRAIPFLLFNLLIRGMNAIVIHGNVLTKEKQAIYLCINESGEYTRFSELYKLLYRSEDNIRKALKRGGVYDVTQKGGAKL